MADMTTQWIGADNNQSPADLAAERALFLKVFSGEVLAAFEANTVTLDKHTVRTIAAGKSASFPVLGRTGDAVYHEPGTLISGQTQNQSERIIPIDKLLIKSLFIADIEDAMTHFDVRGKYAWQMGHKLAQTFDRNVMREALLAARASATVTGGDGGFAVTSDDLKSAVEETWLLAWRDALYDCAINFDNKFITGPRYCLVQPSTYRALAKSYTSSGWSILHRDYGVSEGSTSSGEIPNVAGIQIIPAPTLPTDDSSLEAFHGVDASKTKGIVFTPDAVGTVKLMDVSVQSDWKIEYQGTLMVARNAIGHGILAPECAAEIATVT